jgi:ribosome-associated protein
MALLLMENLEKKFINPAEEMDKKEKNIVPEDEITEQFSRSSGAGGQNINRVSTKAEARWNIEASAAFTDEEKEKIKQTLKNRINEKGELIIRSQEERSQSQNREQAIKRLNKLVQAALKPEKERVATKPTLASKKRRLQEKKRLGEKKRTRSEKPKNNDY